MKIKSVQESEKAYSRIKDIMAKNPVEGSKEAKELNELVEAVDEFEKAVAPTSAMGVALAGAVPAVPEPAFPCIVQNGFSSVPFTGVSKRLWVATQIASAYDDKGTSPENVAKWAYTIADALIAKDR